ncbi:MAG: isoprenoid biosynthesis glyoxalase ElbB [Crocinitomix sp.]|nr:isoprenoid biosynthesis glyoxalase ElbB [Crocinitomix sp.]|tara:strand:+ start:25199 stop:25882 length:684 start_codon:yes stop_codon:yes gene_type:complete
MKIGVLLSGCGVYDGSEIQEAVLTMLAIKDAGHEYICISVDEKQHHVVDHTSGDEMKETRNMLVESARIARGDIQEIGSVHPANIDAVVMPGGFGAAKNFSTWAFAGPDGEILPKVKLFLVNMVNAGKPICALCVSPVVVAKALEGSAIHPTLTLGSNNEPSPYDIDGFHAGIEKVGATSTAKGIKEISIDRENLIVSAPCYMFDTDILAVRNNIKMALEATLVLCS